MLWSGQTLFLSSVSSNIAQSFLTPVLESFFHAELQVRLGALQAIVLILRQGLVHPAQVSCSEGGRGEKGVGGGGD